MTNLRTVLFDLDGTLLDTAPDMAYALNEQRKHYQLPALPLPQVRPAVGQGAKALIKLAFNLDDDHPEYINRVDEYLAIYQTHATNTTRLFNNMETVLQFLDDERIPWGVVTNKPSRFTFDILKNLDLECRAACIICGDTLTKRKPDPDPILHACHLLQQDVKNCVYIGDSKIDVIASKAAKVPSLVALYGYISSNEDPFAWQANGYIREPIEIINWLKQNPA